MADVFVSYSRSDRARVAPLVAALEAEGWSVWWDPAIAPGQQFDRMIADELERARAVLVVWTADSVESRWVRGEAREGADRGILVPVQFGSARLPIDFRAFHTTNLDHPGGVAASPQFQEVLRALEALVGRAALPSTSASVAPGSNAGAASGPPRIAICVLPLANLGGDPEQQYFSDGITADIITELSRWRLLAVRSRSASFKYRGPDIDPAQVARELNVRFVVEGTVRRMGDRVRISVQLIDAETGNHVWGERFDRAQAEIFSVQDEVVQTIVSTLVGRVHASDAVRARRKAPASLDAYECVLEGNALYWDDPAGAAEATRLFERAIEIDPGYGLAHSLLATMKRQQWRDDMGTSTALLDEAHGLATRAVELDDSESTCHSLLAQTCLYRRQFDLALEHIHRSLELNPNNQWNVADMGLVLVYVGRAEEAVAWNTRARQIDPYFDQPWYWRQFGLTCMVLGRYQEALNLFARHPVRKHYIAAYMAGCHARLGDMERARACVAECLALRPDFSVRQWMSKEPFKLEADAERIAESLRLAGLPDTVEPAWVADALDFWFGEIGARHWFSRSAEVDGEIRERFLALYERLVASDAAGIDGSRPLRAAVIVLDQFSRNMFRDTPRAFAADPLARRLARQIIERGFDSGLAGEERLFVYLPFEHSEDRADQALSCELIGRLGNDVWTQYALAHKAIIDRFGRFPHRNAVLGRTSTAEEMARLAEPMGSF
jgi:uncharacterized protein (DUF924 family)/TolB-like protein/Tfp pilus assembly protein PilF